MTSVPRSVDPIASAYQQDPWEPTVDTSDGNQKKAGKDYTDVYGGTVTDGGTGKDDKSGDGKDTPAKAGKEPALTMVYTTAPDFLPGPPPPKNGTTPPGAMESGLFGVQLSALRATEQTFLDAASGMIAGYDTLRSVVDEAASGTDYFGQQAGYSEPQETNSPYYHPMGFDPDTYDQEAAEFAAAIVPQMKNLLNSIGHTVEACGQFTALLNNAGQTYATIDNNSVFRDGG